MIDSSVLTTQKWSFVKFCDSKCKSTWICKEHFNIAAVLYGVQAALDNTTPFGIDCKIPENSIFAR